MERLLESGRGEAKPQQPGEEGRAAQADDDRLKAALGPKQEQGRGRHHREPQQERGVHSEPASDEELQVILL